MTQATQSQREFFLRSTLQFGLPDHGGAFAFAWQYANLTGERMFVFKGKGEHVWYGWPVSKVAR